MPSKIPTDAATILKKESLKVAVVISFRAIDCGAVIFNRSDPTNERGGLPLILLRENTGYIQTVLINTDMLDGFWVLAMSHLSVQRKRLWR